MAPKYVHTVIPGTCKYYLYEAKGPCRCDGIKGSRRVYYPVIWELDVITTVLLRVTQEESEEKVM